MIGQGVLATASSPRPLDPAAGAGPPLAPGRPAERLLIWVSRLIGYALFAAVLLRVALLYGGTPELAPSGFLLALYLALYASFGPITRRAGWYPPAYLVLQAVVIAALLARPSFPDFVAVLFVPLSVQAAEHFTPRQAAGWIGLFGLFMLLFFTRRWDLARALASALVYLAICGFIAAYGLTARRALAARACSQALWQDLHAAARQLEAHAARQEALAAARERSRLARELHDSVTQTIFSLTLTAQSAVLLLDRDPARLAAQLDRLEALAGSALAELRALVAQLDPAAAAGGGLLAALQRHLDERRAQDGLEAALVVEAPGRLLPAEEANLFRIVQEALNNVVKHARASRARVSLRLAEPAWVEVSDEGRGFVIGQAPGDGHLGLAGMRARAEEIGWRLAVTSAPGAGTRVRVEQTRQEGQP